MANPNSSPLDALEIDSTIIIDTGTLFPGNGHELGLMLDEFRRLVSQQMPQEVVLRAKITQSRIFDLHDE